MYLKRAVLIIACDRRTGRKRRLNVARVVDGEAPGDPVLEGRYVAFPVIVQQGVGPEFRYFMRVVDGTGRGKPADVAVYTGSQVPQTGGATQPSDLVVARGVAVAWIVDTVDPSVQEVRYRPRKRPVRTLETSNAIEPGSLALGRRFVY